MFLEILYKVISGRMFVVVRWILYISYNMIMTIHKDEPCSGMFVNPMAFLTPVNAFFSIAFKTNRIVCVVLM